jgi:hypothetical protein
VAGEKEVHEAGSLFLSLGILANEIALESEHVLPRATSLTA